MVAGSEGFSCIIRRQEGGKGRNRKREGRTNLEQLQISGPFWRASSQCSQVVAQKKRKGKKGRGWLQKGCTRTASNEIMRAAENTERNKEEEKGGKGRVE